MKAEVPHVCVGICTFRRPELLRRLLEGLTKLRTTTPEGEQAFTLSAVVVDNDAEGSARTVVEKFLVDHSLSIVYEIEPERNFARVRNRVVALAKGDFLAFIDDDEVPAPEWMMNLLATQSRFDADGVLGPVRPYFEVEPPGWIKKGRLCDRPIHPTGMTLGWTQTRTGNTLLRSEIFDGGKLRFDPAFAIGGEDVDFFKRAIGKGYRFIWCEEAPAYELVPPARLRKSYFLKRALLQGQVSLRYAGERLTFGARARVAARSLTALLLYVPLLPVLALGGFHWVMKYLIKISHHSGQVLAATGIRSVQQRNF